MNAAIVVQARLSSRRLPGKVLKPLAGEPAIVRMMERVSRVSRMEIAVVATSDQPGDDPLVEVCRAHEIAVVRGSLDDVLGRVAGAVPADCDTVVRLTGDCPLVDPRLVDRHLEVFEAEQPWAEYVTNAVVRTQPDGLDVEVIRRDLLERACREAVSSHDREHVTPWIQRHARALPVTQEVDLSRLRWTLDDDADYTLIAAIYEALYPRKPDFDSQDVYTLMTEHPDWIRIAGPEEPTRKDRSHWIRRIKDHLESSGWEA